jgi:ParB-like chromosome segregation protein Spo0J
MELKVHNPNKLATIDYKQLEDFQGDFKLPMSDENLTKLKNSLVRYGVFIPKYVWVDKGKFKVLDGHQTKKALQELENEGYEIPGIPYVMIDAKDSKDALKKLLQINSEYANVNPFTTILDKLGLSEIEESLILDRTSLTSDILKSIPDVEAGNINDIPVVNNNGNNANRPEQRNVLICPECGGEIEI